MSVEGLRDILSRLRQQSERQERAVRAASQEVADLLESYARTHTGTTRRPGRWIYPPGAKKRWRGPGVGWGDVTGLLRKTIRGSVRSAGTGGVDVILSANTPYAPRLELGHGGKWKWLKPAVMNNSKRIIQIFERHLRAR